MRIRDLARLSWDQVRRRKVVTGLCAAGISIGCAAIIVALSMGESAQNYIEEEMNAYFKMDEITVRANEGVKEAKGGADANELARGQLTEQKRYAIEKMVGVKAVVPMLDLGNIQYTSGDKQAHLQLIATDLEKLEGLGETLGQGSLTDGDGVVILSYGATLGLIDEKTRQNLFEQMEKDPFNTELMDQYMNLNKVPTALYQRQIQFRDYNESGKQVNSSPLRVAGVLKKPDTTNENMIANDKKAYISLETGRQLASQLDSPRMRGIGRDILFQTLIVKVDRQDQVEQVEKQIRKLTLSTQTNLHQRESLASQFKIIKGVALGGGIFILIIASISIVVAMTMSTYQRRRQIGIMKVLGANLAQIRNMFIVEAALLGLLGGLLGVLFSYWIIWGINIIIAALAGDPNALRIFIPLTVVPIGMVFAIMTGILSGIYPAINASRTDALTAIRRE